MTAYNIALPVPLVNQHTTQTTDGRITENADLDCGPSCCASAVGYVAGVTFLPDEAKDIIWQEMGRTPETTGPTDVPDLAGFLSARAGISVSEHSVGSTGIAMSVIRDALFVGHVLFALRFFSTVGQKPYHWVEVCGAAGPDDTHTTSVSYMDPWDGTFKTVSNTDFFTWLAPYYADGSRLLLSIDASPRR